jgi:hypothetical protein
MGGMAEWIAQIDVAGALQPAQSVHPGDFDVGIGAAVADKPDSLLVAGTKTVSYAERPSLVDAWLARMKHNGMIVWQKSFDRAHMDMAAAMLPLRDGGCVLAINSGKYNKFGAGPTALWLIRCDADGNKVAESVIDGAQIYARGQKYLAPLDGDKGDSFVVAYTVGQLSGAMEFEAHLQAFDGNLHSPWSRKITTTSSIGSMLIVRRANGDIAGVASAIGASSVVFINPRDGEVRRQIALPLVGNFDASDILDQPDGVAIVAAFQEHDRPRERDLDQDVLILKVR